MEKLQIIHCNIWLSFVFLFCLSTATSAATDGQKLLSCLASKGVKNVTSATSTHFISLLDYSLQNQRFDNATKPYVIVVPVRTADVQAAVTCSVAHGYQILARSGGHSYEGLSSTSDDPNFLIVDLMRLDSVSVDVRSNTAWAGAGATLGQIYSAIAAVTDEYAFPAGVCPTIGAGGHFSGGGFSLLSRKYGLAADNVLDAVVVNAAGKVLSGAAIPRDVFWALRGGGGGSFGVVVAWKIRLVPVPKRVTAFNVNRNGAANVTALVHRWQTAGPAAEDEDLFVRAVIFNGGSDVSVTFNGLYLGRCADAVSGMRAAFPELAMLESDCQESSWIDAVAYVAGENAGQLSNRYYSGKNSFKAKSDFVTAPISEVGLRGAWKLIQQQRSCYVILAPMGGVNDRIASDAVAFPRRKGYIYFIQYVVTWQTADAATQAKYVDWIRRLYAYMAPYVSSWPRAAYVNYLDLDLGVAHNGTVSMEQARRTYGEKYFGANFDRLVRAKTIFDPANVFRHLQSIPTATAH